MKFGDIKLIAFPHVEAYCRNCKNMLIEVSNGLIETVMFCPSCKNVYQLKLIKIKASDEFIQQTMKHYVEKQREN